MLTTPYGNGGMLSCVILALLASAASTSLSEWIRATELTSTRDLERNLQDVFPQLSNAVNATFSTTAVNSNVSSFIQDETISRNNQYHSKLETLYNGTIESTGVVFTLENNSSAHCIISGLGLNVKLSSVLSENPNSAVGGGRNCRVMVFTKAVNDEVDKYQLALDTTEVQCMGPNVETIVPPEEFLKFYRKSAGASAPYGVSNGRELKQSRKRSTTKRGDIQGGTKNNRRRMQLDGFNQSQNETTQSEWMSDSSATGKQEAFAFTNDPSELVNTNSPASIQSEFSSALTQPPITSTTASLQQEMTSTGQSADDTTYPLLIAPRSSLQIYIVVLPIERNESGIEYSLLSSSGTNFSSLYQSDSILSLYESSSIKNGYLLNITASNGNDMNTSVETEPTLFNGAVYYDLISYMTLDDYFNNLQYSIQHGSSHLGYLGCDSVLTTEYVDNNGSYGLMFDVFSFVPHQNTSEADFAPMSEWLEIYGMDVYIRNIVTTSIEVYVHSVGGTELSGYNVSNGVFIKENWKLIAKGVVEGRGPNIGTPIDSEFWFENVVLRPHDRVGFYVTVLDEPHLRYRNSSQAEGSIYIDDGTLGIGVGRSWGQYPLIGDGTDYYFIQREFSGSLRYHAHENTAICRSTAPSSFPTNFPTYGGLCKNSSTLQTTFQGGFSSFGAMFDIRSKVKEIILRGINLNIDWSSSSSAQLLLYARKGSWFGFQSDLDAWPYLLINTTIYKPNDFQSDNGTDSNESTESKTTSAVVPSLDIPLRLRLNQTWALYASISIPRMIMTYGTSSGNIFASNPELDLMEGTAVAIYPPFKSELSENSGVDIFFSPRVFNGKLVYDYQAECPSESPSYSLSPTPMPQLETVVTYEFYVEHSPKNVTTSIPSNIERGIFGVLYDSIMNETSDLYVYAVYNELKIASVSANIIAPTSLGFVCVPTAPNICTPISVDVKATHKATASTEQVSYSLYRVATTLPSLMNINGYKIIYIGELAVETVNEITLSGVPAREMWQNEELSFAQVALRYLKDLAEDPYNPNGLKIVSVDVNEQIINGSSASSLGESYHHRLLQSTNNIRVQVKGQYNPPPVIDFGKIVEDSINADPEKIAFELKNTNEISTENSYFQEVEVIGGREIKEEKHLVTILQDDSNPMKGLLNIMAGVVGGLIAILLCVFFLRPHRRKAIFGLKSDEFQIRTKCTDQEDFLLDGMKSHDTSCYNDHYKK